MADKETQYLDLSEEALGVAMDELDTVQQGPGAPAPGKYAGRCIEVDTTPSKSSGNPMITLTMEVETLADGTETDQAGKTIRSYYVIKAPEEGKRNSDFPLRKLRTVMDAAGLSEHLKDRQFDPDLFLDTKFAFDIIKDTRKRMNEDTMEEEEIDTVKLVNERSLDADSTSEDGDEVEEETVEEETEEEPPKQAAAKKPATKPAATKKPAAKAPPPTKGGKANGRQQARR